MSNKVLIYGVLESTNNLRSVFVGHIHFKKVMKFRKLIKIFHFSMARLRNTSLGVFIQCHSTRTILRKKNMGQNLFKKHLKFQNVDEILYCWRTRFRNVKLDVFRQYQNTRTILKGKSMGQNRFKETSKFQKFQSSNFNLTWSNEGKVNSVRLYMTYSKEHSKKGKCWTNMS